MYVEPMLLETADKPFNDDRYIVEWKQDGWRMLLIKWNGKLKLFSRHRNEFTSVFKEFQDLNIPDNTILDCELISVDSEGKCDFETLQKEYRSKNRSQKIVLVAFDIIFYKNQDLRRLPLLERKNLLKHYIEESDQLAISRYVDGSNTVEYFELIKQQDLEGIVMKEKGSFYESRRSTKWLKVLNLKSDKCYIGGVSKEKFGVYLNYLDGKYAGKIEFMKSEDRKKVYGLIKDLKIFEDEKKILFENKEIVEVAFRNKYRSGLLRLPKLVSWY